MTPGDDRGATARDAGDDVAADGVFTAVRDGYEAVYASLSKADTFNRIWRETAYGGDFPIEFAHIGFLTSTEAERLLALLQLARSDVLVDVACGGGGPGLWAAQQSGASLIGVDPTASGLESARARAAAVGLSHHATFRQGTFEQTGLPGETADAVMTIEAFQYAPDKQAALAELFRVLKPGGRLGIVCFEVDPTKVVGVPVLGVDPVIDHTPLLNDAGFVVDGYEETPGWADRVYPTFQTLLDAADTLASEMGEQAAAAALAEAMLTVGVHPYPRRVMIVSHRPEATK